MKIQVLFITVIALMMSACGKSNKSNSSSTRVNRYQNNQISQIQGSTNCGNSWGRIYDNSANDATFRQRVLDFTLRADDQVGDISPLYNSTTGIEFQMSLNFSGGLLRAGSKISFRISDSATVNDNAGYIFFVMAAAPQQTQSQGGNGQFDAYLGDSKGYTRLKGSRVTSQGQQIYYGNVFYSNNNATEEFLGEFVIQPCAVSGI